MSEWISVKDRLPEKSGYYLIWTEHSYYLIGFFSSNIDNGKWDWIDVTHWMPLPEPPK